MRRACTLRDLGALGALRALRAFRAFGALRALRALALLAVPLAVGCHDLPDLGTCGNGIVEEANGEACDPGGVAAANGPCTPRCELRCMNEQPAGYIPVGTVGMGPDARAVYCPGAEFRCGFDTICRAPSGEFESLGASLPFNVGLTPVLGDVDNDGLPDLVGTNATNIYARFASTGAPLESVVVQEAPSSEAPYLIFDPDPAGGDPLRSDLLFAVPTEGVALLRSDDQRFAPELDLPITVPSDAGGGLGLVVRDPDPVLGDVVLSVQAVSTGASIDVRRVRVEAPDHLPPNAVEELVLPACVGGGGGPGPWRTVAIDTSGDRRAFVIVTQRGTAATEPWHVCRYTQVGGAWTVAELDFTAPTPLSAALANLDGDPCLELVVRTAGLGLSMLDAAGPACGLAVQLTPLPFFGSGGLLGAGQIDGTGIDELVLTSGVYRPCTGMGDCAGSLPGTFRAIVTPTKVIWSAAAVVDLNRDGVLDVVAARMNEGDVDVVRGGATPNVYRASTSGPISSMVAGDFDGDRLGDVAMTESGPMGERVVVLFGTQESIVGAPRAMSSGGGKLRLDRIGEVGWVPSKRGRDGIDDLLVVKSGTPSQAGLAFGDAARLMTSPRFPPDAEAGFLVDGLAAGAFRGSTVELFALVAGKARFYDLVNEGARDRWSAPLFTSVPLRQPVAALRDGARVARGAAAVDELGSPMPMNPVAVFSVQPIGLRVDCMARAAGPVRELRGIDLDGDGVDEVAVLSDRGMGGRAMEVFTASCQPLLGQGESCIAVASAGVRRIALCKVPGDTGMAAGAFRGVFELVDGGGGRLVRGELITTVEGDGRFALAGDFDGDGVLDVAVGVHRMDEVFVQLLRQCPDHDTRPCRAAR